MANASFNFRLEKTPQSGLVMPSGAFAAWTAIQSAKFGSGALFADDEHAGTAQQSTSLTQSLAANTAAAYGLAQFLSRPLAGQSISSGNWTFGFGMSVSAGSGFTVTTWSGEIGLYLVNGSTGALRSTIIAAGGGALIGAARNNSNGSELTCYSTTIAGSAVTVTAGDYLAAEIGLNITQNATHTQNLTMSLYTSGTGAITTDNTATSNAWSLVTAPQALIFAARLYPIRRRQIMMPFLSRIHPHKSGPTIVYHTGLIPPVSHAQIQHRTTGHGPKPMGLPIPYKARSQVNRSAPMHSGLFPPPSAFGGWPGRWKHRTGGTPHRGARGQAVARSHRTKRAKKFALGSSVPWVRSSRDVRPRRMLWPWKGRTRRQRVPYLNITNIPVIDRHGEIHTGPRAPPWWLRAHCRRMPSPKPALTARPITLRNRPHSPPKPGKLFVRARSRRLWIRYRIFPVHIERHFPRRSIYRMQPWKGRNRHFGFRETGLASGPLIWKRRRGWRAWPTVAAVRNRSKLRVRPQMFPGYSIKRSKFKRSKPAWGRYRPRWGKTPHLGGTPGNPRKIRTTGWNRRQSPGRFAKAYRHRVPGTGQVAGPVPFRARRRVRRLPILTRGRYARRRTPRPYDRDMAVHARVTRTRVRPWKGHASRPRVPGTGLVSLRAWKARTARKRQVAWAKAAFRAIKVRGTGQVARSVQRGTRKPKLPRDARGPWLDQRAYRMNRRRILWVPIGSNAGHVVAGPYYVSAGQIYVAGAVVGDVVGE